MNRLTLRLVSALAAAVRAVYDDFPSAFTPQLWANVKLQPNAVDLAIR